MLNVILLYFYFALYSGGNLAQDSITFSPDRAPCVGDPIEIICSIVPPPSDTFGGTVASVSINGSTDFSLAQLNSNSVIDGIDLGRYSANINGLIPSIDMPVIRLIINSYLPLDSDTIFLCATTFNNGTEYDSTVSGSPKTQAVPPSPPVSLTAGYNSPTCSGTVQLAWTPGASDRDIEMYFLSLNGVILASLGPVTSYTHTTTLQRDTEYTYSVVAMSCAGNSIQIYATTSISVGSYSLSDGSPPFFISYNQSSNLFVDWSLVSPNTGLRDILIEYSLDLYYNYSQSDTTTHLYSYTSSSTFQQISTDTDYTVALTPHSFNTADGVVTNITVCLQITQQCGLAFSGVRMCAFFNSDNPPTTTPPTTPTTPTATTTPLPDILSIIIGCVTGVGAILLILVIILFLIMLYVCCIRNRGSHVLKEQVSLGDRVELVTQFIPYTQPEVTFSQVKKKKYRPSQKKVPSPPNLNYADRQHMSVRARVNSSIPPTNYSSISQLPDHTTYADVN